MSAIIMDGTAVANKIKADVRRDVAALGRPIGLAAILVGDDPASQVYVRAKERDCESVGMISHGLKLPAETTQEEL
ncbi:tetrahydrofolate dehydrogenase/cyclohydrolase catalytic domain-containing protein, partial [Stomatohabitans albus]|uniref:tetrahydrofolate dehydrogenase/cyclohydrolase catalytic domain-containing protein n=1 Tax=Stomatohabitans albus TaxID=3110766 RepID=UPI00300D9E44